MPDSKPEALRELERAAPGTRFRRIYEARQGSSHGGLKNRAFMFGGLAVIAAGVATYPIPVIPSELVILLPFPFIIWGADELRRLFLRKHVQNEPENGG